jgi:hypothetical protein
MSVFDSAALGAAACDAADTDTTPATTAAVIATLVNTDLRIVPPWRAAGLDAAGAGFGGHAYLPGSIRAKKMSVGPSLASGAAMAKIAAKP